MHPTMQCHILLKDKNPQFKILYKCSLQLLTTYVNKNREEKKWYLRTKHAVTPSKAVPLLKIQDSAQAVCVCVSQLHVKSAVQIN